MLAYVNPNLNSISTKLQHNLISTSLQPQRQINLSLNINLNSTLTLTQYGCDIKATQSCKDFFLKKIYFIWIFYDFMYKKRIEILGKLKKFGK